MTAQTTKPYVNGNGTSDFVPAWMSDLGVKPKEWLNMTKAQLRSMQRPDKPLKVQVWATGMLHSSGYNTQEATTMRNNKKVPLAPGDISNELLAVAKQHYQGAGVKATEDEWKALKETKEDIRQTLKDLEEDGVAMRLDSKGTPLRELSLDQLRRLPSGRTRMLFWAIPRPPSAEEVMYDWQQRQQSDPPPADPEPDPADEEVGKLSLPMPPIWQILKGLQIAKPEKAQIADPQYQKTVERAWLAARKVFLEVVAESLPDVAASSPREVGVTGGAFESKGETYKEETATRAASGVATPSPSLYKGHPQSSSSAVRPSSGVVNHQRKSKAEEEEESALYQIFKAAYPAGHFDGAKAKPLFDGKKKSEQLAAIERLRVFVASDRWKDDDGRWIPLASTWLQSAYTEDPPPLVKKKTKAVGSSEESYFERRVREEREASNG